MKKKFIILSIVLISLYYMVGLFFIQAKISKNIDYEGLELLPAKKWFRWGYIDQSGNVIIKQNKLHETHEFSEGLAVTYKNNLAGYINKKGEVAINPQFYFADRFSEGLAVVGVGENQINVKYGYIDKMGNVVIEPKYDYAGRFSEGLAEVGVDGRSGFINKSSQIIIEPLFYNVKDFSEGLAVFQDEHTRMYGYIDRTGQIVIEANFSYASHFSGGLALVSDLRMDYGYIDKTGKYVVMPEPGGGIISDFSEGLAVMLMDGKYIIRDELLNIVSEVEDKYNIIIVRAFNNGLAAVAVETKSKSGNVDRKWGFIDKTGKMVIAPVYDEVGDFNNDIARVIIGKKYFFRKVGYIDKTGKYIWNPTL